MIWKRVDAKKDERENERLINKYREKTGWKARWLCAAGVRDNRTGVACLRLYSSLLFPRKLKAAAGINTLAGSLVCWWKICPAQLSHLIHVTFLSRFAPRLSRPHKQTISQLLNEKETNRKNNTGQQKWQWMVLMAFTDLTSHPTDILTSIIYILHTF